MTGEFSATPRMSRTFVEKSLHEQSAKAETATPAKIRRIEGVREKSERKSLTFDGYLYDSIAGRWSLVAGRWSLVAGRWSLVAGRWSLVAGRDSDMFSCLLLFH